MLFVDPLDEIGINAIDNLEENHGIVHCHLHTTTFTSQIVVKIDILIEIYVGNYDPCSGLANGVYGIMKVYTKRRYNMDQV